MQMRISIKEEDPQSEDATLLMASLSQTLKEITGSSGKSSFDIDDLNHRNSFLLIARSELLEAVGCGSVRQLEDGVGEIKRMYSRVPGTGTELLKAIERRAIELGYKRLILETRKTNTTAVQFYLKHDYQVIPNYGRYIGNTKAICFQRILKI